MGNIIIKETHWLSWTLSIDNQNVNISTVKPV